MRSQIARKLIAFGIELGVGKGLTFILNGDEIRGLSSLLFYELVNTSVAPILRSCAVVFNELIRQLSFGQQRQSANRLPRISYDSLDQRSIMLQPASNGRCIKQIRIVLTVEDYSGVGLHHIEVDIKDGKALGISHYLDIKTSKVESLEA